MRKLYILRSVVSFLWVMAIFHIAFLVIMIPTLFFVEGLDSFSFLTFNLSITEGSTLLKICMVPILIAYIIIYWSLYYFKQVLNEFSETHIFSEKVIVNFKKIGNLLLVGGFMLLVFKFIFVLISKSKLVLESNNEQVITICFGLFFIILSEIFKISKVLKQENDLTV